VEEWAEVRAEQLGIPPRAPPPDSIRSERSAVRDRGSVSGRAREESRRQGLLRSYTLPVAILVNEGTASAAEVFTAALRDNGRAVVIGSR